MGYLRDAGSMPVTKVGLPAATAAAITYGMDRLYGGIKTSIDAVPDCARVVDEASRDFFYREMARSLLVVRDWGTQNPVQKSDAFAKVQSVGDYLNERLYCEGLGSNGVADWFYQTGTTISNMPDDVQKAAYTGVLAITAIVAYVLSVKVWDGVGSIIAREKHPELEKKQNLETIVQP